MGICEDSIDKLDKFCREKDFAFQIGRSRVSGQNMWDVRVYHMSQSKDEEARNKGEKTFIIVEVGLDLGRTIEKVMENHEFN